VNHRPVGYVVFDILRDDREDREKTFDGTKNDPWEGAPINLK